MRCVLALLLCLCLLAPAGIALADTAPMSAAGPHLQPIDSTTVRLERERIEIHLQEDLSDPARFSFSGVAQYRVLFHFVPAADERMTAGFPLFVYDPQAQIHGAPVENFRVSAGDREIPSARKSGFMNGTNVDWAVFDLTFEAGKPLDLEVRYSLRALPYGKSQAADLWIAYVLRTGAFWAGAIGQAEAVFTMDRPLRADEVRVGGARGTTPGWALKDGALHWTWQEVEPDFDLSVQVANAFWLDAPAALGALAAGEQLDRNGCLKLLNGMTVLFEGDARYGTWLPLRGESSGQAAERL